MNHYYTKLRWAALLSATVVCLPLAHAQTDVDEDEEVFELSPFIVTDQETNGYLATSTLAGTRIKTDLRDLSTPLSVVTAEFLKDTGSTSNEDLLVYTTNTEVGGLYGNFGGFGNEQGISDRAALLAPNNNTRVRGLETADNTRNYFLTNTWWDSYNIDRVEIQRGPNSILFGVGSPSGIINSNTIVASMDGIFGKVENELSSYGSVRFVMDLNVELIDDLLAVRGAGLISNKEYQQEPAFTDDERFFATASFTPQLFPKSWASKLNIRASYETVDIEANNPRILPPIDAISLWFEDIAGDGEDDLIGLGKQVLDPYLWDVAGYGSPGRGGWPGDTPNPFETIVYAVGEIDSGPLNNGGIGLFYINGESDPFWAARARPSTVGGIDVNGEQDDIIAYPYGQLHRPAALNQYTRLVNQVNPDLWPLANRSYYKDLVLTDPTIFNFYEQLIDGDNKRELTDWETIDLSVSQTFWDDRFGFELYYYNEQFNQMRKGHTWNSPYIGIDINKNLTSQLAHYERVPDPNYDPEAGVGEEFGFIDPSTYSYPYPDWPAGQQYPNPMAGAAITGGSFSENNINTTEYTNYRGTMFGEFRASDVFDEDGWLAHLIGKHIFTGLLTRDETNTTAASYYPTRTAYDWAAWQYGEGHGNADLSASPRGVTPIIYLTDPLTDPSITSASGLNLPPVMTNYTPKGTFATDIFIGQWQPSFDPNAPSYVDPAAQFTTWEGLPNSTQSSNPDNYLGWVERPAQVLNADAGDLEQLVSRYNEKESVRESIGLVWQGYFLDGLIVPTVGWREDRLIHSYAGDGETTYGVASMHIDELTPSADKKVGHTLSWGVVGHMPQKWMDHVPVISGLSAYYNYGENTKPEVRVNYDGELLDDQSAESHVVGIVVSMFDDKLTAKVSYYKTQVKNQNLPYSAQALGAETWRVWQMEAWLMANALMYSYGLAGEMPSWDWAWGLAHIEEGWDGSWWTNPDTGNPDPTLPVYREHPVTQEQLAAMDDIIYNADTQFFDNYDIPIDVPAVQAAYQNWRNGGDIQGLIDAAGPAFPPYTGVGDLGSRNNGNINGVTPNGTIDSTSKGYEVEINWRPIPNWNIQVNASKTDAFREDIGAPMREFIEKQWARLSGPAGDVHMWWGGDLKMRDVYEDSVIAALEFTEDSIGHQAPELRPWRFSAVTNYSFVDGALEGLNVGGAYRWADNQILGYGLTNDLSGLDVNKPIEGGSEGHFDLWVGYTMDLTDRVSWRIQLNVRNVGEGNDLIPISANPDGQIAAYRIAEGTSWALTNSIRF